MNKTTKIKANHFAIVYETPERKPKPRIPETIAITKNIIAQTKEPD